ncbi:MAG TPA: glycoside hydrolase family 81, partial [Verrucomicrobiae bacterium]
MWRLTPGKSLALAATNGKAAVMWPHVFMIVLLALISLRGPAEDFVRVGAGSYATRAPEGTKRPPALIYRTVDPRGGPPPPMPSNDWWSSLAWVPFSERHYAHPLAMQAQSNGFRIFYPGPSITANKAAIFGFMPPDGMNDLVIGHSAVAAFPDARVDGFSDWFVTAAFVDGARSLKVSYGHGSPFVFVNIAGGNPTVSFQNRPEVWASSAHQSALGITVSKRHYGLFAPDGTAWSGLNSNLWTAKLKSRDYFAVAVLPDAKRETFELFRRFAYNQVTGTSVSWDYDEKTAVVRSTFIFTTTNHEGNAEGTLFALYPHQWNSSNATLTGHGYPSVRGTMKLASGEGFKTSMSFPGALPSLPLTASCDRKTLETLITEALKEEPKLIADTYLLGKQLGKWATLIPLA